jgi:hypothetical protein
MRPRSRSPTPPPSDVSRHQSRTRNREPTPASLEQAINNAVASGEEESEPASEEEEDAVISISTEDEVNNTAADNPPPPVSSFWVTPYRTPADDKPLPVTADKLKNATVAKTTPPHTITRAQKMSYHMKALKNAISQKLKDTPLPWYTQMNTLMLSLEWSMERKKSHVHYFYWFIIWMASVVLGCALSFAAGIGDDGEESLLSAVWLAPAFFVAINMSGFGHQHEKNINAAISPFSLELSKAIIPTEGEDEDFKYAALNEECDDNDGNPEEPSSDHADSNDDPKDAPAQEHAKSNNTLLRPIHNIHNESPLFSAFNEISTLLYYDNPYVAKTTTDTTLKIINILKRLLGPKKVISDSLRRSTQSLMQTLRATEFRTTIVNWKIFFVMFLGLSGSIIEFNRRPWEEYILVWYMCLLLHIVLFVQCRRIAYSPKMFIIANIQDVMFTVHSMSSDSQSTDEEISEILETPQQQTYGTDLLSTNQTETTHALMHTHVHKA